MTAALPTLLNHGKRTLLVCLTVLLVPAAFAQMSPGPLSKAHHDLEGTFQCSKCHTFGGSSPELKCLECHGEIARRLTEKRGYHAAQAKPAPGNNDCARCHSEHNGPDYRIVRWPGSREKFDHALAGWRLEGKHAQAMENYVDNPDR